MPLHLSRIARPCPVNPISIVLLGLAMSTDAFAAAVGKGAAMARPRLPDALRAGIVFGVIETITPAVGWLLGTTAASYVTEWDHWLAFGLLGALGLVMIWRGLRDGADAPAEADPQASPERTSLLSLAVTGFATSIDAMAVGVSLAFVDTPIVIIVVAIGLSTTIMVTIGVMVGRLLGAAVGRKAEIAGGLILVGVGSAILYQHLSGA